MCNTAAGHRSPSSRSPQTMATVHPSRMRLIPEGLREAHRGDSRTRSPSPRRRSRSPRRNRSRTPDRERERNRDRGRDRDREDRGKSDHRESEKRRASPQYEDYRRPPPPHMADNRGHDNMYPPRQDRHGHIGGGVPYGSAGGDFMESRRKQREALVIDVWPPSPKHPARDLSPPRKKSSKHSKRRRSVSSDSDSEEERRRKEKKEKKRAKRKEKDERRDKRKHHRSRSRGHDSEDDESDEERKHKSKHRRTHSPERERDKDRVDDHDRSAHRHRHRTRSKSKSRSKSRGKTEERMDVDRHEKAQRHPSAPASSAGKSRQGSAVPSHEESDEDDDEVGPQPMYKATGNKKVDERAYGGALLRGEGSAMAAFLQDGTESRIPRRGEIGLTSDEIAKYEDVGYVMSGSRHKRMNAVRMRKENQVISAEEKRGILKLQKEERDRRELILREELLDMMNEKLKSQAISSHIDPPLN